ncbi:DNA-binding response regulator [Litoribrevibacter albus]|uniref:DNA-binding response regulator n=2 Tax=Litoribrevibacter albus TaxID=1473156 RepID=A0AA37S5A8_9GAMM|nr:DNA-binding response regulator [Litoribrevibacter albus]
MNYRILVADDHPLFRAAINQIMSVQLDGVVIDETDSVSGLQAKLEENQDADLILLDLHMPGAQGFSALVFLRNHYPDIPVVVISAQEDPVVIGRAMQFGAAGFIPKSAEPKTIKHAIETVLGGDLWSPEPVTNINERSQYEQEMAEKLASLTPSQFKVLVMMNEGLLNKQIAYELEVSEATIKAHATAIFQKLGVRNRTQAVIALHELDIEHPAHVATDDTNSDQ